MHFLCREPALCFLTFVQLVQVWFAMSLLILIDLFPRVRLLWLTNLNPLHHTKNVPSSMSSVNAVSIIGLIVQFGIFHVCVKLLEVLINVARTFDKQRKFGTTLRAHKWSPVIRCISHIFSWSSPLLISPWKSVSISNTITGQVCLGWIRLQELNIFLFIITQCTLFSHLSQNSCTCQRFRFDWNWHETITCSATIVAHNKTMH